MFLQIFAIASLGLIMVSAYINTTPLACPAEIKCGTDYPLEGVNHIGRSALNFWEIPNLDVYCSSVNKNNFKNQVKCVINATRTCGDAYFKIPVASGDKYAESVDIVCSVVDDFNPACINLFMCLRDKLTANTTVSMISANTTATSDIFTAYKKYTCNTFKYSVECAAEDQQLADCPKNKTKSTYITLLGKLKPEACLGASDTGDDDGGRDSNRDDDGDGDSDGDGDDGDGPDPGDDNNGSAGILLNSSLLILFVFTLSLLI